MNQLEIRPGILRTPDSCFAGLPDYSFAPHYVEIADRALGALRMHYVDEGAAAAPVVLMLHGNPTWSYLYRHMIGPVAAVGYRVIAPDMIGFGKSDKPKKDAFHRLDFHQKTLAELVERLDLKNIVLVLPQGSDWPGLSLPTDAPQRYRGLLRVNLPAKTIDTETDEAACKAPFPDSGHAAALRAFARMTQDPVDGGKQTTWHGRIFSSLAEALGDINTP